MSSRFPIDTFVPFRLKCNLALCAFSTHAVVIGDICNGIDLRLNSTKKRSKSPDSILTSCSLVDSFAVTSGTNKWQWAARWTYTKYFLVDLVEKATKVLRVFLQHARSFCRRALFFWIYCIMDSVHVFVNIDGMWIISVPIYDLQTLPT